MSKGKMRRDRAREWERRCLWGVFAEIPKISHILPLERAALETHWQSVWISTWGSEHVYNIRRDDPSESNTLLKTQKSCCCGTVTAKKLIFIFQLFPLFTQSFCSICVAVCCCSVITSKSSWVDSRTTMIIKITLCCWSTQGRVGYSSMLMWLQCVSLQWHNWRGDITRQSHDIGRDNKHARADIAEPLHHCRRRGGHIQHTSTPTWASERIVSERCFSWKQVEKYRMREEEKEGKQRVRRREGIKIKYVRKSSCYICQWLKC